MNKVAPNFTLIIKIESIFKIFFFLYALRLNEYDLCHQRVYMNILLKRRGQTCLWKVSTLFVEGVKPFCGLGWIMHIMPLVVTVVHIK